MAKTLGKAYGRVSLLGNPSDIYGGKCISFTFDRCAEVELRDAANFSIQGSDIVESTLEYNGKHDLIKAAIKQLGLEDRIQEQPMQISYKTSIPVGFGLAGSAAIVIATMKALNSHFSLKLNQYEIAENALYAELNELGISAGFQDRYVISFKGLLYMDFSGKEYMRKEDPYGSIKYIPINTIPCFLSLGREPKTSSSVHNAFHQHFLRSDRDIQKRIKNHMDSIAMLAEKGIEVILKQDWKGLGELMNKNTELRDILLPPLYDDSIMIEKALRYRALGAKVAGSGGTVVVLADKEETFNAMSKEYRCFKPRIVR
jgi:glucuronokinase